ncbi:MAG: O-antigen ligase family protein, partial [Chloroflexota bacterium]|nr:O-antigen ligase family protein [Chloroflexota bacterium]
MTPSAWLPKARKILWAIFLVSLPLSSFPYFPGGIGGETEVRPFALYPLAALLVLVTLPRLFTKSVPRTVIPLAAFALAALASTAFAYTQSIDPNINISVTSRSVRMLVTLALGGAFYLTAALTPTTFENLRFSLRWLYAGLIMALLWGTLQVVYIIRFNPAYFDFLSSIQEHISTRHLFTRRVSGMTYEPNWFAEQIAFLWMPWLFAALMSNRTVFGWRCRGVRWLTVEALLLPWAATILVFTYSRAGLAFFILQLILAILFRTRRKTKNHKRRNVLIKRAVQVGLVIVILAAAAFLVGSRNNYFSRLWRFWTDEDATGTYFQYIAFSQRFAYWEAAYTIFGDHPLLGIGLGNFTFYFQEALSDRPLYPTPELVRKFTPEKGHNPVVVTK